MRRKKFVLILCSFLLLSFAACSQSENATKPATGGPTAPPSSDGPAGKASRGGVEGGPTTPPSTDDQAAIPSKTPPPDVVRVSGEPVEIKAGGTAAVSVKLMVANGYHINANPPSFPYLIATELNVEPGEGVTAGKPVYPASVMRNFSFAKEGPLAVYEGETTIKLPLTATVSAKKGEQTLRGKLQVQPCDDASCFPPRKLEVSIPVTVK